MPKAITAFTEVSIIDPVTGKEVKAAIDQTHGCRDEWLHFVGERLQSEAGFSNYGVISRRFVEVAKRSCGLATVKVRIPEGVAHESVDRLAQEANNRYKGVNRGGVYLLSIEPVWCAADALHVTFSGNEWSLAAAWWFWLLIRLRSLVNGESTLALLNNSHEYSSEQWYDSEDKDLHIELWEQGAENEPNPLLWLAYQVGPMGTRYESVFGSNDGEEELEELPY